MNEKERKVVVILVAILLVVMVATIVATTKKNKKGDNKINKEVQQQVEEVEVNNEKYVEKLDDGTKLNNSTEFNKNKKFKNLEISNIQFTSNGGNSVLLADVKNTSSSVHEMEIVEITILGVNGEVIETLAPVIGTIKPEETIQLNAIATADLVNAKDFIIKSK